MNKIWLIIAKTLLDYWKAWNDVTKAHSDCSLLIGAAKLFGGKALKHQSRGTA